MDYNEMRELEAKREAKKQIIDDSIVVVGGFFAIATMVVVGLQNWGII